VSAASTFPLTTWNGEGGSAEKVPSINLLVLGSTGLRGSANRGRIFLPSVRETVIDGGILNAGAQTTIQAAWSDFLTTLQGNGATWGVASYANAEFNEYTSVFVPQKFGIIKDRRRLD